MRSPSPTIRLLRAALVFVVLAAGGAVLAPPTVAQVSATVSPSLLDLNAQPGATGEQEISILIESAGDVTVVAEVIPYQAAGETRSAEGWLTLDQVEQTVAPGDSATFTVTIQVPEDAEPGGHYAMISLTSGVAREGEPEAGQAAVQGRFNIPVLITVGDEEDLERRAEIPRVAPFLEPDGRIGIWGEITNTGNIAIRAPGAVTIEDDAGEPVAELTFPETTPILPGETQVVRATGTLPLPDGADYTAETSFDIGGDDPIRSEATFTLGPVVPDGSLVVCENLDRGPTVTVALRNPGDLGVIAVVAVEIDDRDGNQVAASTLPDQLLLWPDTEQTIDIDAPARLETGRYTLRARIQTGETAPTVIEQPFEIGGTSPETAPLCGSTAQTD